jgi:plastocyanin
LRDLILVAAHRAENATQCVFERLLAGDVVRDADALFDDRGDLFQPADLTFQAGDVLRFVGRG